MMLTSRIDTEPPTAEMFAGRPLFRFPPNARTAEIVPGVADADYIAGLLATAMEINDKKKAAEPQPRLIGFVEFQ